MVKRCCYGVCNTDSRYEDRLQDGVYFLPFPKKSNNLEKCLKWIKACGRPHSQFNVERITRATYICSKHFVNKNGPTEEYPDPIPFDGRTPKPARKVLTKRVIETPKAAPNRQVKRKLIYSETSEIQTTEITPDSNKENIPPDFKKENTVAIQTEGGCKLKCVPKTDICTAEDDNDYKNSPFQDY
ncbi:unnamed protein product [Mytilus edulis]|uniref:THAP-type domain-containing protein n=1 Tax=Mytilus edulis TaxID=6550 RepID=A0A8S3QHL3_MYTED|nr:unnamed protein product [Mytilus edulis]